MSRRHEWQKGKQAEGCRPIRPILTPEAVAALDRLKLTHTTTNAVVNAAIIHLDAHQSTVGLIASVY